MNTRLRFGGATALLVALLLVGCQRNPNAPASVNGKVTYNGGPVTGGSVSFHFKDGVRFDAPIRGDGTYLAIDIPAGDATVTVETESINPANKKTDYNSPPGAGMKAGMYGKGAAPKPSAGGSGKGAKMSPAPDGAGGDSVYMKIPPKYADKEKSGLTVAIKEGKQTSNFELTD
jgi:hypothetical protein